MKTRFFWVIFLSLILLSGCSKNVPGQSGTGEAVDIGVSGMDTLVTASPVLSENTGDNAESGITGENTAEAGSTEQAQGTADEAESDETVSLPELSGATLVSELTFSKESGCYNNPFLLTIEAPASLTVYYTTDGSNPLTAGRAFVYENGIPVMNRRNAPNIVNAVDTALYDAANVKVDSTRKGFKTTSKLPSDSDIDKCTVIRAVGIDKEGNATPVYSATYFTGSMEKHVEGIAESSAAAAEAGMIPSLAVISITADFDDIFGYENGIYVKGKAYDEAIADVLARGERLTEDTSRRVAANYNRKGRDWERRVHIDFFEADGNNTELILSQDCGIRIQGNYSRSDLQKGFRLYAREEYGTKNFKYPVFGEDLKDDNGETIAKFKTLTLRNGGNCAFTTKYSADFWAYAAQGTEVETLASRPAVVYLNGEYWGLYVLEEDYSKHYFANKHGVDKDSVVLYKGDAEALALGYKLDLGDLPDGITAEDFYLKGLLRFFDSHTSCESDEDYAELCKYVDPESVRDYFAVETWINNKWDWPGKNWSMWKVASFGETKGISGANVDDDGGNKYADGRWRFCFYDLEFGGVSGSGDANINTIKEDNYKTYGLLDMDTSNPAVLCFAYCMTNAGFREDFYNRLRELSDEIFEQNRALAILDGFCNTYSPLYDQFFKAFPNTGSRNNSVNGGYASNKCIADFLKLRKNNIETMIDWCERHYN